MHIVHLYKDAYPPVMGGVERMIWWVARRQAAAGHRVTLLVARPQSVEGTADSGADATCDTEEREGVHIVRQRTLARPGGTPLCPGMTGRLRQLAPDIVHLHHPNPSSDVAYLLSGVTAPLVVTYHSDVVRQRLAYRAYRPVQQRMLRAAAAIMPTSQRYLETSSQLAPHRDRCRVVPLGVELPRIALSEEECARRVEERRRVWGAERRAVLFVGVLRYYKGLRFLLEAAKLSERTALVIVGDGPERPSLEELASSLGIDHRVYFLGFIEDEGVRVLQHAADLFCMPSHLRAEAFGLSMVEAMHAGMPCVACDLPTGVPEVNEHEKTGLIVPPSKPAALAAAFERLYDDAALRERLGEAARTKAQREYTADRMAERIGVVYDEVLGASHGR